MKSELNEKSSVHDLVVDLDGTLLKGDLLWESLVDYLNPRFWRIFFIIRWYFRGGKSLLKYQLAQVTSFKVESLPWNEEVVQFCQDWDRKGGRVILATASNEELAKQVTCHFSFISEVVGSSQTVNLKGQTKAARLEQLFGTTEFDYLGDSSADLPVWKKSKRAWFVGRNYQLIGLQKKLGKELTLVGPALPQLNNKAISKALRPHQWLKNLLVFIPILTAHRWSEAEVWYLTVPVFLSLCCLASAAYVWNDLTDLQADRAHPQKRTRPLASASLQIPTGITLVAVLFIVGLLLSLLSSPHAVLAAFVYFLLTILYSSIIKTIAIFDVLYLSGLYTYRIVLGGIAGAIFISPWLLAFATTFFLGLAFMKRFIELGDVPVEKKNEKILRRGYTGGDASFTFTAGVASSFFSIVILSLYLESSASSSLYERPEWLWGMVFALLAWILNVWFLAFRKKMADDPVWFAARDPFTYLVALFSLCMVALSIPRT